MISSWAFRSVAKVIGYPFSSYHAGMSPWQRVSMNSAYAFRLFWFKATVPIAVSILEPTQPHH